MREEERIKRPVLPRTKPSRAWSGAFRAPVATRASGAPEAPAQHSPPPGNGSSQGADSSTDYTEFAYDALNGAYRVIDDYLRQAQQLAEGIWTPLASGGSSGPNAQLGVARVLQATGDLASAYLELLQQGLSAAKGEPEHAPRGTAGPFAAGRHQAPEAPVSAVGGRIAWSVSVEARQPVTVALELHAGAEPGRLWVGELHAAHGAGSALAGTRLESSGLDLVVRLRVPDEQPAGIYHGVVLETGTDRPRGTLSVALGGSGTAGR